MKLVVLSDHVELTLHALKLAQYPWAKLEWKVWGASPWSSLSKPEVSSDGIFWDIWTSSPGFLPLRSGASVLVPLLKSFGLFLISPCNKAIDVSLPRFMSALGPDWFSGDFEPLSESFVFGTRFGRGFRSSAAKRTIHSLNESSFTEDKWLTLLTREFRLTWHHW